MEIVNRSSRPTAEIRRLIRFATKGLNARHAKWEIVDSRKHATGHAWKWGNVGHGTIVIRIPSDRAYPLKGWRRHRSGPVNHDHRCWRESVVALAAHEAKHIDIPASYYRNNSQQAVEMNCEAYERHILDAYRQKEAAR